MADRNLARTGDLIFYKVDSSNLKDRLISFFEKLTGEGSGTYSHVSMLDGTLNFQYEATLPKIRRSAVDWANPLIEIWRIKDVNDLQLRDMLVAASMDVGRWYGLGESLSALFRGGRLTICTQYVIDSAAMGYIDLAEDKGDLLVSPDEFIGYKALTRIT